MASFSSGSFLAFRFDDCWGFGGGDDADDGGGDGDDVGTVAVTVAVGWLVVDIFIYLFRFFCSASTIGHTRTRQQQKKNLERSVSVYQVSNYPYAENSKMKRKEKQINEMWIPFEQAILGVICFYFTWILSLYWMEMLILSTLFMIAIMAAFAVFHLYISECLLSPLICRLQKTSHNTHVYDEIRSVF